MAEAQEKLGKKFEREQDSDDKESNEEEEEEADEGFFLKDEDEEEEEEEEEEDEEGEDEDLDKQEEEEAEEAEVEPYDYSKLPDYACNYCGIHHKDEVVKCNYKTCNQWFCNGKGKARLGSHIVLHLVKAKHKEISLHPEGSHGETNLECYVCGNKNIFLLGFVPIQAQEESQVIIICRLPCLNQKSFNDLQWDPNDWTALVEEKMLVNWLVKPPSDKDMRRARPITIEQINELEEARKLNPEVKLEDLRKPGKEKALKSVTIKYEDGKDYCETFLPLIEKEAQYDKKVKESQTQSGITVRWEMSLKKKRLAYFIFASKEDFESNLLPGNELKLSLKLPNYPAWSSRGHVVKITANEEVCLELSSNEAPPNTNTGYTVEFVWKSTSFRRMKHGLKRFWHNEESISSYLYYRVLGIDVNPPVIEIDFPKVFSAPGLPELNIYQVDAVKKALRSPLCLIQGPPGTGKTITSASIVYHLATNIQRKKGKGQVLVCAPSNIVVDQLADKIHKSGVKVVRICSKSREAVSSNVEFLTLHNQVRSLDLPEYSKLQQLFQLLEDQGELNRKDEEEFKRLREKAENAILTSADVICATCITAADPRLNKFIFHYVLIDEATQAIEPECLLPLLKGAKQMILVGDHRQLGPVITCRETARAGLNISMFERLVSLGIRPVRLQVQYRMHPELSIFPSNTFYEGTLQNGVTVGERDSKNDFPWPNKAKPMFFLNLYGVEEISASGTSYLNRMEVVQIEKIVYHFLKSGVKASQLGIITPYKGQRAYIVNYLMKNGQLNPNVYKEIEVASVDGFQGREKDYIIISCVRSNDGMGIGFLIDPRRLNVTLTRARYGLIICGNAKVLSRDNLWNNLLCHFKENELLVEGSLGNLRISTLKFRQPQKYIVEKKNFQNPYDDDARSTYSQMRSDNLNTFDSLSMSSLPQGNRHSTFGFSTLPDSDAFKRIPNLPRTIGQELKPIENYFTFIPDQSGYQKLIMDDKDSEINFRDKNKMDKMDDDLQGIGTFLPQDLLGPDDLDMNFFTGKKN